MRWYVNARISPKRIDWNLVRSRAAQGATVKDLADEMGFGDQYNNFWEVLANTFRNDPKVWKPTVQHLRANRSRKLQESARETARTRPASIGLDWHKVGDMIMEGKGVREMARLLNVLPGTFSRALWREIAKEKQQQKEFGILGPLIKPDIANKMVENAYLAQARLPGARTRRHWEELPEYYWSNPEYSKMMSKVLANPRDRSFWLWLARFPRDEQAKILIAINSKRQQAAPPRAFLPSTWTGTAKPSVTVAPEPMPVGSL